MDIETFQAASGIAQSITVVTVLIAWLIREARIRDRLSDEILEDYRDMRKHRILTLDEKQ